MRFYVPVIGAVIPLMNFCAHVWTDWQKPPPDLPADARQSPESHRLPELPKEQGLFTPARFASNMFDILSEAHIQHTVCFVEDQRFNRAAIEVLFFMYCSRRPVVATTMS